MSVNLKEEFQTVQEPKKEVIKLGDKDMLRSKARLLTKGEGQSQVNTMTKQDFCKMTECKYIISESTGSHHGYNEDTVRENVKMCSK